MKRCRTWLALQLEAAAAAGGEAAGTGGRRGQAAALPPDEVPEELNLFFMALVEANAKLSFQMFHFFQSGLPHLALCLQPPSKTGASCWPVQTLEELDAVC